MVMAVASAVSMGMGSLNFGLFIKPMGEQLDIGRASFGWASTFRSISSAATAITNVGPGLGNIVGPASTFAELPNAAKWVMSLGMLIGRLEIFIIITIFTRSFWNS